MTTKQLICALGMSLIVILASLVMQLNRDRRFRRKIRRETREMFRILWNCKPYREVRLKEET